MRAVETLTLLLAATVLFMWAILAHGHCVAITRIGNVVSPV